MPRENAFLTNGTASGFFAARERLFLTSTEEGANASSKVTVLMMSRAEMFEIGKQKKSKAHW